jgi:hypothetical protein
VARNYHFKRPWGLPVRFHDIEKMLSVSNLDLVEFHMSYRDLDIDPASVFKKPFDVELVVHGVETFANDRILDLASPDEAYRTESIKNLQRCIDPHTQTKKLLS